MLSEIYLYKQNNLRSVEKISTASNLYQKWFSLIFNIVDIFMLHKRLIYFIKIFILRWIFTVYILYITENCSTTQLCEYLISIRNMEARKAHLCHWNETQVVISSHVSSSCPSASPAISYQWVLILNHQLNTISIYSV